MLRILSCTFWPSVCLLWRNVYLELLAMFDWVICLFVCFELHDCLYILEINPLSVASFANIFPHYVGCLFILFMISFAVQKLLSLIKSHLFLFLFHYFRRWIQKNAAAIYVKECSASNNVFSEFCSI